MKNTPNTYSDTMFSNEMCMFYYRIEDYEHALDAANKILENEPDNHTALLVNGLINEAQDRLQRAITFYDQILSFHDNDATALKRKAYVEMLLHWEHEALRDINQCLTRHPGDPEAHLIKGMVLFYYFNNKIESIISYNNALRLDPENAMALYHRGYAYLKYGNTNYARDDFEKASRLGYAHARRMLEKYFTDVDEGHLA